jgi:MSHA biogenesis protein MshE
MLGKTTEVHSMSQGRQGVKIGQLLVNQGVLTAEQVEQILAEQKNAGRPFGDLAERLFGISPEAVEKAWIEQYLALSTEIDLDQQRIDVQVLRTLNRRQAWQFRMLPIRREDQDLVMATSRDHLKRAVNFAWRRLHDPVYFMIARRPQLEDFLMRHYPWPGAMDLPLAG